MITILVALEDELAWNRPELDGFTLVYTGVGKVNAALHSAKVAMKDDCELIINYGSAGALQQDLVGTLSEVSVVRQRDMDARPLCDIGITPFDESSDAGDIDLNRPNGVILSTGDQFVTAPPALTSQLVDMEAYAIVKVAKAFGKEVVVVKYGSDFADENASLDWAENCAKGQTLFLEWLKRNHIS